MCVSRPGDHSSKHYIKQRIIPIIFITNILLDAFHHTRFLVPHMRPSMSTYAFVSISPPHQPTPPELPCILRVVVRFHARSIHCCITRPMHATHMYYITYSSENPYIASSEQSVLNSKHHDDLTHSTHPYQHPVAMVHEPKWNLSPTHPSQYNLLDSLAK